MMPWREAAIPATAGITPFEQSEAFEIKAVFIVIVSLASAPFVFRQSQIMDEIMEHQNL